MAFDAFLEQGNTVLIAATSSTASTPTQLINQTGIAGLFISNPSTIAVYVGIGSSTVQAAVPTTATPCEGFCLPPYGYGTFSVAPSSSWNWVSAATSAGSAVPGIFATPGKGI